MKKCGWSGTRKLLFNRRSFTSLPILRSGSYASVLLGSAMVFYKTFYQHRHDAVASIIQTGCFEGFVCPFPVQSAVLPGSWTTGCLSFWMPGGERYPAYGVFLSPASGFVIVAELFLGEGVCIALRVCGVACLVVVGRSSNLLVYAS
ncbi:hypothetical protein V1264_025141 [Littorina saxatilis]